MALFHFRLLDGFKLRTLNFPDYSFLIPTDSEQAVKLGDVGITQVTTQGNRVIGWSFIFPMDLNSENSKLETIPTAFLFGRVANSSGLDWIKNLVAIASGKRHDLTLDLETDNETIVFDQLHVEPPTSYTSSTSNIDMIEFSETDDERSSTNAYLQLPDPRTIVVSSASTFILDISSLTRTIEWQFFIQPVQSCAASSEFISILANWCRSSSLSSLSSICKGYNYYFHLFIQAIPKTLFQVPVVLPSSLNIPLTSYSSPTNGINKASKVGDFGVTLVTNKDVGHNRITGFDLIFPQPQFEKMHKTLKLIPTGLLFGRITNPMAVIQLTEEVDNLGVSEKLAFRFTLRYQQRS